MNYVDNVLMNSDAETLSEDEDNIFGNLKVTVLDEHDTPMQSCVIVVYDDENEYTCTTGKAGGCNIRDIPIGEYNIRASMEEYNDIVIMKSIRSGDNSITITLKDEDKI